MPLLKQFFTFFGLGGSSGSQKSKSNPRRLDEKRECNHCADLKLAIATESQFRFQRGD